MKERRGVGIGRRDVFTLAAGALLPGVVGSDAGAQVVPDRATVKVIVVGAHPDDPETGCGGTMVRLTERGRTVVAAYLTAGEAGIAGKSHEEASRVRRAEAIEACRRLGARPVFLGQVDGATDFSAGRYAAMERFLYEEEPDIVLAHWPVDTHRDHRIASLLVYDAWLRLGRAFALYYFEVMTGAQTQNFRPTHYVDISSSVAKKHAACFAHVSQKIEESYPMYHGRMEIYRGMEAGVSVAEAFVRQDQSRDITFP